MKDLVTTECIAAVFLTHCVETVDLLFFRCQNSNCSHTIICDRLTVVNGCYNMLHVGLLLIKLPGLRIAVGSVRKGGGLKSQ